MAVAAVVGDNVHNHLYAVFVRIPHELAVLLIASEAAVDVVVVCAGVAVVAFLVHIVLQKRGVPYGGNAEVLEIAQLA